MPRQRQLPSGMWRRGNTYYARFRANGRLVRKRLSTDYRAACEMLNDLRSRADRADFNLLDNSYAWADLKAEFLRWAKQSLRPPVFREYERDVKKIEEYCRVQSVAQIDSRYVIGFREWRLAHNVTPRTVNRQVGTLRNMLAKGVLWGRIGDNPIADIKPLKHDAPAKERRPLSVAEVEALFKASPEHERPVWRMFMTTGIRKGELVNMRFEDVDHVRKVATFRASTAKSHKAREIPLDDEMLETIAELEEQAGGRQSVPGRSRGAPISRTHVFVTGANTPWRNNLLRAFYRTCKRADIDGAENGGSVDIHSLRVTFTTLALEAGANPRAVQAILGHSTLAMTMNTYARATERSKRDAVSALPFAQTSPPEHVIPVQNAHTMSTNPKTSSQDQPAKEVS